MVKGEGNFLFCGDDDFLKEESKNKLISSLLGAESRKLNCDIYNARDDHRDIFNSLNSLSLLSAKRVVVIKDVECLPESKKKPLLEYLKRPHIHIHLILQSSQSIFSDKFIKALSDYAETYYFKKLKMWEVKDWVYKRISGYKKSITKDALDLLLERKGRNDLAVLAGEIEKLVTYKGDSSTITEKDVSELVGKSVTKKVFDLIDAVSFKDRDSAISLARELSNGRQGRIPEVIGFIGWQLRRIWRAKDLLAQKNDERYIIRQLKIKDFLIDRFLRQVKNYNIGGLKRCFKLLLEADRSIKTGYKRPQFALEQLIVKLCD